VIDGLQLQRVEGTAHRLQPLQRHVEIAGSGADVGVAQQDLDGAQIGSGVQHMGGASVAEGLPILLMIRIQQRSAIGFIRSME
jgi:hypothetical protein